MKKIISALLLCIPAMSAHAGKIEVIESHVADTHQSIDEFAISLRKRIGKLAFRNQAEVCGAFYFRDGRYGVELVTSGAHMACYMRKPEGFTGETIHTHPNDSHGLFSDNDYAAGPGYLVVKGTLIHQSGKGTDRRVNSQSHQSLRKVRSD